MIKRSGIIFFLVGFLILSFAGSICLMGKINTEDIVELIGSAAEEEDETERDSKVESDDFIEIMESLKFNYVSVSNNYLSYNAEPILQFDPNTLIQPPESFAV